MMTLRKGLLFGGVLSLGAILALVVGGQNPDSTFPEPIYIGDDRTAKLVGFHDAASVSSKSLLGFVPTDPSNSPIDLSCYRDTATAAPISGDADFGKTKHVIIGFEFDASGSLIRKSLNKNSKTPYAVTLPGGGEMKGNLYEIVQRAHDLPYDVLANPSNGVIDAITANLISEKARENDFVKVKDFSKLSSSRVHSPLDTKIGSTISPPSKLLGRNTRFYYVSLQPNLKLSHSGIETREAEQNGKVLFDPYYDARPINVVPSTRDYKVFDAISVGFRGGRIFRGGNEENCVYQYDIRVHSREMVAKLEYSTPIIIDPENENDGPRN